MSQITKLDHVTDHKICDLWHGTPYSVFREIRLILMNWMSNYIHIYLVVVPFHLTLVNMKTMSQTTNFVICDMVGLGLGVRVRVRVKVMSKSYWIRIHCTCLGYFHHNYNGTSEKMHCTLKERTMSQTTKFVICDMVPPPTFNGVVGFFDNKILSFFISSFNCCYFWSRHNIQKLFFCNRQNKVDHVTDHKNHVTDHKKFFSNQNEAKSHSYSVHHFLPICGQDSQNVHRIVYHTLKFF